MRALRSSRTIRGMSSGRHTVTIELDASSGTPRGRISVDGGVQRAFYGWIDLTARLEALTRGRLPNSAGGPHAWVERRVD